LLKKSITFKDFNGDEVTETHFFHLGKADVAKLELSHKGGWQEYLNNIIKSEDGKAAVIQFDELILMSYGKKSEDGKRFIKSQELRDEFQSSQAYDTLFFQLCTDAEVAAEFFNGIVPADLASEVEKITARAAQSAPKASLAVEPEADPTAIEPTDTDFQSRVLTHAEVLEMGPEELKAGLATGKFRLQ
jgi:hypothetical protein